MRFLLPFLLVLLYSCNSKDPNSELIVPKQSIAFGHSGGEDVFEIHTSEDWEISGINHFCEVIPSKGKGNAKVTIIVKPNQTNSPKDIIITVLTGSGQSKNINISQSPSPTGELIEAVDLVNTFSNGDIMTFNAKSELKSIHQLITPTEDKATLDDIREFYVDFNTYPQELSFNLTLKTPVGMINPVLCIYKSGYWEEISPNQIESTPTETTAKLQFEISKTKAPSMLVSKIAFIDKSQLMTNVSILKDPFEMNPLSALIEFDAVQSVNVTTTLVGQDNNDIVVKYEANKHHVLDILGLYNTFDNKVYIDITSENGTLLRVPITIHIDHPHFYNLKMNTNVSPLLKNTADEVYVVSSINANFNSDTWTWENHEYDLEATTVPMAFDKYGKLRWILRTSLTIGGGMIWPVLINGKEAWAACTQSDDPRFQSNGLGRNANIFCFDNMGRTLVAYEDLNQPINQNVVSLHHEFTNGPGTLLAIGETKTKSNINDECEIIEIDYTTGLLVGRYDLSAIIDADRIGFMGSNLMDRIHINSIAYSPNDDSYVISMRYQGVCKIRRSDKSLVWWLTANFGVNPSWQHKLLKATNFGLYDSWGGWNSGQHTVSILPNGDIMMFDNHNFDQQIVNTPEISRIWIVRVDENNMTVTEVFSKNMPKNAFSIYMSSSYWTPENTIVSSMSVQQGVWEISYPDGKTLLEGYFSPKRQRGDIYRIYKKRLY